MSAQAARERRTGFALRSSARMSRTIEPASVDRRFSRFGASTTTGALAGRPSDGSATAGAFDVDATGAGCAGSGGTGGTGERCVTNGEKLGSDMDAGSDCRGRSAGLANGLGGASSSSISSATRLRLPGPSTGELVIDAGAVAANGRTESAASASCFRRRAMLCDV